MQRKVNSTVKVCNVTVSQDLRVQLRQLVRLRMLLLMLLLASAILILPIVAKE